MPRHEDNHSVFEWVCTAFLADQQYLRWSPGAQTMAGEEYHCYEYAKTAIVHSIHKVHAVSILTPHFRRTPSFLVRGSRVARERDRDDGLTREMTTITARLDDSLAL